jgi:tetratricopeptide (TPR) repeat protein
MKKILAVAALFALSAMNIYAAKTAGDIFNSGYDLYVVNDYKGAVKMFKQAIKLEPEFVKPYNMAGLCYIAMKEVDHALYMYKQAVYIDPNFAEAYYDYGVAMEIKDPKATTMTEQLYQKAIDLKNDDHIYARASLNLAKLYRPQAKHDEAIELLRNAIKVEPTFQDLYNEAGLNYLDEKLYDKAEEMFSKAVELKHEYVEAQTNLAITYEKKGNLARAITELESTLKKDDKFAGAQFTYGNALIASGYYDKAIEHLKVATTLDPKFAEAYYSLGKAYLHKNMFTEAEAAYKMALHNRKKYTLAKKALDYVKKLQKGFRDHIAFPKLAVEGEEDETTQDLTDEQIAAAKKKAAEAENVEDLRLPDDKPKPKEGEETAEGQGNTENADEF